MNKYDRTHSKNIAIYQKRVQQIMEAYEKEITALAGKIDFDPDKPFSFGDYPAVKKKYDKLISDLAKELRIEVEKGVEAEWKRADEKNDALAVSVANGEKNAATLGYLARNNDALQAFIVRKSNGMTLSDRVWDYTGQYSTQIQDAIDIALREDRTADELSRDVRKYLKNPDALFRRVRDEHGVLHLSKRAKAYHPGQGVYRSAYMNARRLAATEINMAYRSSDYMRQQKLDFVVGIEVHLSNNHNCKGIPQGKFYDICDELQGRYPKQFKFTGWHPHCRCYTTTVLKTPAEMKRDSERIRNGERPLKDSANEVKDVPKGFKDWVENNSDRIAKAKSLPYFLKDNGQMVDGVWEPYKRVVEPAKPTPLEIAAKRHAARTPELVQRIQEAWNLRRDAIDKADALKSEYGGIVDFDSVRYDDYVGRWSKYRSAVEAYKKELDKRFDELPLLDNPKEWARKFTLDELDKVQAAVEAKLAKWKASGKDLQQMKNSLEFEIKWVEDNKKYPTWEVAQGAYGKELVRVNDLILWDEVNAKYKAIKGFKTYSKEYKGYIKEYNEAMAAKDGKAALEALTKAEAKKQDLEAKAAAKAAKKAGSKTSGAIDPNDPIGSVTSYHATSSNNVKQTDHIDGYFSDSEKIDAVMKATGVDKNTAKKYVTACRRFSLQWDYEIRSVQSGNNVVSRHGHTIEEICETANILEDFIAASPKWDKTATYRGMSLSRKELAQAMKDLRAGTFNNAGSASWSTKQITSEGFARYHIGEISPTFGDGKRLKVVIISNEGHYMATSIKHLSEFSAENEVLASKDCRYRFKKGWKDGDYIYIEVEPVR